MSLGNNIKRERVKRNMSQEQLAKELFVTRQTISRYESNERMPDVYMIKKMADLFNISIEELLQEDGVIQTPNTPSENVPPTKKKIKKSTFTTLIIICSIVLVAASTLLGVTINSLVRMVSNVGINSRYTISASIEGATRSESSYRYYILEKGTRYKVTYSLSHNGKEISDSYSLIKDSIGAYPTTRFGPDEKYLYSDESRELKIDSLFVLENETDGEFYITPRMSFFTINLGIAYRNAYAQLPIYVNPDTDLDNDEPCTMKIVYDKLNSIDLQNYYPGTELSFNDVISAYYPSIGYDDKVLGLYYDQEMTKLALSTNDSKSIHSDETLYLGVIKYYEMNKYAKVTVNYDTSSSQEVYIPVNSYLSLDLILGLTGDYLIDGYGYSGIYMDENYWTTYQNYRIIGDVNIYLFKWPTTNTDKFYVIIPGMNYVTKIETEVAEYEKYIDLVDIVLKDSQFENYECTKIGFNLIFDDDLMSKDIDRGGFLVSPLTQVIYVELAEKQASTN